MISGQFMVSSEAMVALVNESWVPQDDKRITQYAVSNETIDSIVKSQDRITM